jgi:hypothetical protein
MSHNVNQANVSVLARCKFPFSTTRINQSSIIPATYAFLLTATLAWSIWTGGVGLSQLLKYGRQTAGATRHASTVIHSPWRLPSLGETGGASSLDGAVWSFPGCNIGVLSAKTTDEELQSLLADFSACPMEPNYDYQTHSEAGVTLLQLMRDSGAVRREMDGLAVYALNHGSFKAHVIAKASSSDPLSDTFLAGIMAQKSHDRNWNVWGLTPAIASSAADEESYLLPLSHVAQTVCRRMTASGEVLFELVDTSANPEQLREEWSQQGWEIRPMNSGTGPESTGYLCKKHNNVIFVWSAQGDGESSRLLMKRIESDGDKGLNLLASRAGI